METVKKITVRIAVTTLIAAMSAGVAFVGVCGLPEILNLPLSKTCRMVIEPFLLAQSQVIRGTKASLHLGSSLKFTKTLRDYMSEYLHTVRYKI